MKRRFVTLTALVMTMALLISFPATNAKAELQEGMSQGDFALWLVKSVYALSNQRQYPPVDQFAPAANAENAIRFLSDPKMGLIPEGGWKKDDPMTAALLKSLLPNPDDPSLANASFSDLAGKLRDYLEMIFDQQHLGIFGIQNGGTPSVVS